MVIKREGGRDGGEGREGEGRGGEGREGGREGGRGGEGGEEGRGGMNVIHYFMSIGHIYIYSHVKR